VLHSMSWAGRDGMETDCCDGSSLSVASAEGVSYDPSTDGIIARTRYDATD
jgi:hypothetical protein